MENVGNSIGDSIQYIFKIKNVNGNSLRGATVKIAANDGQGFGAISDSIGRAIIRFPKNLLPAKVGVSFIGHENFDITENEVLDKEYSIYLKEIYSWYRESLGKGSFLKYKFIYLDESNFLVKEKDDNLWLHYEKFN